MELRFSLQGYFRYLKRQSKIEGGVDYLGGVKNRGRCRIEKSLYDESAGES